MSILRDCDRKLRIRAVPNSNAPSPPPVGKYYGMFVVPHNADLSLSRADHARNGRLLAAGYPLASAEDPPVNQ